MRIVFMGSPEFSVPVLEALVEAGHEIVAVYCQPPRPAGRGKKERVTAVHSRAEQLGLTVYFPKNFKQEADLAEFEAFDADLAVVVAYGLILPQRVLDAPKFGCWNIHASLLPRWRGAAPIHRAIMAGDTETGVCIMQMDAGLDTGDILLRDATAIGDADTTQTLHDRLSQIGARLIVEAIAQQPSLSPEPQPSDGVTYAEKIDKAEAAVDWSQPATQVSRQIRGLSPFPGAWTTYRAERIKLLFASVTDQTGNPGEVLDRSISVACGEGSVTLTELQRSGKSRMDAETLLRGFDIPVGAHLGS
ncbi:MAG: methionyl-tRNA formyltransferase [Pseudomonadota bacterium]